MRALWSARENCSHNVSQKVKRIRRVSDNTVVVFLIRTGPLEERIPNILLQNHGPTEPNRSGRHLARRRRMKTAPAHLVRSRRNDNNSLRQQFSGSYSPLVRPHGGWRGANSPKLLSLYFLGKSVDNKNTTFQNPVFLCFRPTKKFQDGSPVDPLFDPPRRPPF